MSNFIIISVGIFLVLVSFIPQGKSRFWAFNIWDYIRPQIAVMAIFWLIIVSFTSLEIFPKSIMIGSLIVAIIFHFKKIWPYLPLAKNEVISATKLDAPISLMISNVYQYNTSFQKLADLIKREKPDLILLVEVNQKWLLSIEDATKTYPYKCEVPIENTYGMALYSKWPMEQIEIRYLVTDETPSIKTNIKTPYGALNLYGVHPFPPVPSEKNTTLYKDKELLLLANELKETNETTIVCGDLNDVAWSNTTNMFQQITKLLDPRKGRRFLATFHVKLPLLRFPLDHIFCSQNFSLISLEKLKNIDSDHYPVLIKLNYNKRVIQDHQAPELEESTKEESDEIIAATIDENSPQNGTKMPK